MAMARTTLSPMCSETSQVRLMSRALSTILSAL
jgi:hypothetical protein